MKQNNIKKKIEKKSIPRHAIEVFPLIIPK